MRKRCIIAITITLTLLFLVSCGVNEKFKESGDETVQDSLSKESEAGIEETYTESIDNQIEEAVTDTLPNMIYYNDTLYYVKEDLFIFEGFRASEIADNYECLGYVNKIVPPNERPAENFSANCTGTYSDDTFPLYCFDEESDGFITTFGGNIQVWYTEKEYNKDVR